MFEHKEEKGIKLPSIVYEKIEKKIIELFCGLGINRLPINPLKIARDLNYKVVPYSNLSWEQFEQVISGESDGFSLYSPKERRYVICYDDSQIETRQKFTIMHEIGHILLGHKSSCPLAEKMADFFASYALVPSPLVLLFDCKDVASIESFFGVSHKCAEACYFRFENWYKCARGIKPHETQLLKLFT